jgi:hypothetical protein
MKLPTPELKIPMYDYENRLESSDIAKVIIQDLNENINDIVNLLSYYKHESRGEIHENIDIDKDSIDIDEKGEGTLCINYDEYYYYGCDDMNNSVERDITLELKIDNQKKLICLLGPELHERDYVDEI